MHRGEARGADEKRDKQLALKEIVREQKPTRTSNRKTAGKGDAVGRARGDGRGSRRCGGGRAEKNIAVSPAVHQMPKVRRGGNINNAPGGASLPAPPASVCAPSDASRLSMLMLIRIPPGLRHFTSRSLPTACQRFYSLVRLPCGGSPATSL